MPEAEVLQEDVVDRASFLTKYPAAGLLATIVWASLWLIERPDALIPWYPVLNAIPSWIPAEYD
jgi:hypothetical protein